MVTVLAAALVVLVLNVAWADEISDLKQKAENGDAEAQFELGMRYEFGDGVEKAPAKAEEWFQKAAEQEWTIAQSVEDTQKLAELGIAIDQYELGLCCMDGLGVERDLAKAKEWFKKAADQGCEDAKKALKKLEEAEK